MIIDVQRFVQAERTYWEELETALRQRERDPYARMKLDQLKRFHYLYQRVSADLAKLATFATEQQTRNYLEMLVARAYGEIHETRERPHAFRPLHFFFRTLPRTFRRHLRAFHIATAATLIGTVFGAFAVALDNNAKQVLLPHEHLLGDPSERVAREERAETDELAGLKARGAAWYMTHNTQVAILILALGVTWGVGTVALLFFNGVLLGAVIADYVLAGQTTFLAGWLLPHGSVEIPAVLIAGQAGLLLGGAIIGWGGRLPLRARLRRIAPALATLIFGVAILLVWAGIVEAFLSQYHEPAIPYGLKIGLGCVELVLLVLFFAVAGRRGTDDAARASNDGSGPG